MSKKDNEEVRIAVRFTKDERNLIDYWANKKGISRNEYIKDAVYNNIKWENGDYDLPKAEIQRLNQLIDIILNLDSRVTSLEDVTIAGFDSLLGLTRGDNYLTDEDGEDMY